jgi:hypothetical protein
MAGANEFRSPPLEAANTPGGLVVTRAERDKAVPQMALLLEQDHSYAAYACASTWELAFRTLPAENTYTRPEHRVSPREGG